MLPRRASRWLVLLSVALSALGVRTAAAGDGEDRPKPGKPEGGKGGKGEKGGKGRDDGKKDEAAKPLAVGDIVKDLSLELAEGGTWSPTAGRACVLVFAGAWATESMDALKRLGDPKGRLASVRADLVGILRDATAEKARETAKESKLTVRLAIDPKRKVYDRFASRGLPYTVVIDGSGKIVLSESGFDEAAVAAKLEDGSKGGERK